MNSQERHEKRYRRRKALREEKRMAFIRKYDDFSLVYGFESLHKAAKRCYKGVMWKGSTQKYAIKEFKHIAVARKKLMNGCNVHLPFNEFTVFERGKERHIRAIHISERVIQKSLCSNVLIPMLSHGLIYDNGACQKGKGTGFAMKRCIKHMSDYAKKHGKNGYILQFDIKSYFDSIPGDKLSKLLAKGLEDGKLSAFITRCIGDFGGVGIGLGSEISQISAVAYLSAMDHFITNQMHFGYYGRYMDDGYAISESKEKLKYLLSEMEKIASLIGLKFNRKKTHITRIRDGIVFLKTRLFVSKTGKVVRIPDNSSFVRERRKLKKLKRKLDSGEFGIEEVLKNYTSWVGSVRKKDSYRKLTGMISFVWKIFGIRIKMNGKLFIDMNNNGIL